MRAPDRSSLVFSLALLATYSAVGIACSDDAPTVASVASGGGAGAAGKQNGAGAAGSSQAGAAGVAGNGGITGGQAGASGNMANTAAGSAGSAATAGSAGSGTAGQAGAGGAAGGVAGKGGSAGAAGSAGQATGGSAGSVGGGAGAAGQPSNGALQTGQELTLTGTGFGTKPAAKPLRYVDFESGTIGAKFAGDGWTADGKPPVAYDGTHALGGKQAAKIAFPDGVYNNAATLSGLDLDEVYLSYRVYVQNLGGTDPNPQLKLARLTGGLGGDPFHGSPTVGTTWLGPFDEKGAMTAYQDGGDADGNFYGPQIKLGGWSRVEHYVKLSSPAGAANGKRFTKIDLQGKLTFSGYPKGHYADPQGGTVTPEQSKGAPMVTLKADADNQRFHHLSLPFFTRTSQIVDVWVDELYLDSTQARVELGDAPTWNACTRRAPQPATSWTNESVHVTVNQADLVGTAYAFVVRDDGEIVSLGAVGSF